MGLNRPRGNSTHGDRNPTSLELRSEQNMAFENLLRPGKINGMEMRNRFIAGPMEKAMANLDGTLNERYIHYSRERAKGGGSTDSARVDLCQTRRAWEPVPS